jgi:cell division protein ZapA (FtsZ GTPase activity inhibitor)
VEATLAWIYWQQGQSESGGQRFTLYSKKSEEDVRQIAAYVNQQLQKAMVEQAGASLLRITLMAAFTIADEYHTATGCLDMSHSV